MRATVRARVVAVVLAVLLASCGVRRVAELTPTTIELLVLSPGGRPLAATVDVGRRRYRTDGLLRLQASGPVTLQVYSKGYAADRVTLTPGARRRLVLYPVAHTD